MPARAILLSLAASIVCGVLPLTYAVHRIRAHSPDAAPLDMSPGYTPDEAYAMIARYGDDVRSFYIFNAFTAALSVAVAVAAVRGQCAARSDSP